MEKVVEEEESRLVQIRLDEALYKRLKDHADTCHRSVAAQVRVAIERMVDTYYGPG